MFDELDFDAVDFDVGGGAQFDALDFAAADFDVGEEATVTSIGGHMPRYVILRDAEDAMKLAADFDEIYCCDVL